MLRRLAWPAATASAAAAGAVIGAAQHDHPVLRAVVGASTMATQSVDANDGQQVASAAVRLANAAGGLGLLSTVAAENGVAARMVQPLPARLDADGEIAIAFHTTRHSAKFGQLSRDGRCTLSFMNPSENTCVKFCGTARRLGTREEASMRDEWPLFPPLKLLYNSLDDFSGWELRPERVQVVSVPALLGGGTRDDWRAPEIERQRSGDGHGSWAVRCKGGMQ